MSKLEYKQKYEQSFPIIKKSLDEPSEEQIGKNVKIMRTALGLSQKALADRINEISKKELNEKGISRQEISNIELGKIKDFQNILRSSTLSKIAKALDIPMEYLLSAKMGYKSSEIDKIKNKSNIKSESELACELFLFGSIKKNRESRWSV